MMDDDKKLNDMMQTRKIPAPSSNLAYRITQAAQEKQQEKQQEKLQEKLQAIPATQPISWQAELWRLFVIPKPAYVTAFCLVIGLGFGFYSGVNEVQAQDWISFLETQEEGEWL